MKAFTTLVLLGACGLVWCYDEKYDNIEVDKILADERLFKQYVDCLLDHGPCDAEYSPEYRRILPEVIATACAKCTPKQAEHIRKTVTALQEKMPEKFKEMEAKYDPKGEHKEDFALFMAKGA